ncbi:RNA-directed DNA polymerase from mobile element jockey [Gracilariopsis chorda]|uniref:RNA-directed DNA polymerase from mobile element jockey n=1 Tax=Gracilariopsis chorda TaxID=448386 RepID=A0A2V3IEM8_9FLOR|nr:RNA-directed DNA polymerase from mobile element jockey [Gracilariopsis chorda]PXF39650.1 RNA-directed DNA polymerase from mobile element jockey [Gracilariopsis chorda]|eukprot:PXF39596.1 RNA-directed DNA polymerase from mobile element jockey [Gracilariopsis chorda]
MQLHQLDALVLTETWLAPDAPIKIPGMECFLSDAPHVPRANRRQGGVLVCVRAPLVVRLAAGVCTPTYQAMTVTLYHPGLHDEVTLSGVYASPQASQQELTKLLSHLSAASGGAAIIAGDLNARHPNWDKKKNAQGSVVRDFIIKHRYRIAVPANPTFQSPHGSSTVDVSICRGLHTVCCVIKHGSWDRRSHHRLVITRYKRRPAGMLRVPRSILNSPAIGKKVKAQYDVQIPKLADQAVGVQSPKELDSLMADIVEAVTQPWLQHVRSKAPRFRAGWTHTLERKSRRKRELLRQAAKSGKKELRKEAEMMDRAIKREFRRRKRRLLRRALAELAEGTETDEELRLDQTLARFGLAVDCEDTPHVDPLTFTNYLASSQRDDPTIQMEPFYPVPELKEEIRNAIIRGKRNKAPGEDGIMFEMLQLDPGGFGNLLFEVWAAVGRVEHMPLSLREGVVAPMYKKGDASRPESYRPIMLLSHMRKAVSSAINAIVVKAYKFHPNQWGFQRRVGTDSAILHANDMLLHGKDQVAILDLKRAYDMVPRAKLVELCRHRLGSSLTAMIAPLLAPTRTKTKGQSATERSVDLVCGVPQGDVISPTLYNIFMEPLLERVCSLYPNGLSCYCDDTVGMADTREGLQCILDEVEAWAVQNDMEWNPDKSVSMAQSPGVSLYGSRLKNMSEAPYLGITLTQYGVTDTRYRERVKVAGFILHKLMRALKGVPLSPIQRYRLLRSQVISRIDYAIPTIPISVLAAEECDKLERRGLAWCLYRQHKGLPDTARAAALVGLYSRAYRYDRLSWKLAWRLTLAAQVERQWSGNAGYRPGKAGRVLRYFSQAEHSPIVPVWLTNLQELGAKCADMVEGSWARQLRWANRHRTRPLPNTRQRSAVPVLRSKVPLWAKLRCVSWYLYKLPNPRARLSAGKLEEVKAALVSASLTKKLRIRLLTALGELGGQGSKQLLL